MSDLISREAAIGVVSERCGICIQRIVDLPSAQPDVPDICAGDTPSADVDLDKYSEKLWAAAYQRGMRHGITTCGVCVHLHDNDCPVLCGRQLDDYCSWAEREGEDEID